PYMSPEQCRDAAGVDARSDIYSLGCTLYVLLTGRTPFSGSTAAEYMSKHTTEAPPPPDAVDRAVPREISAIILRMMAKLPDEGQPDMGAVIRDLEGWMGVRGSEPFAPREEHLLVLEDCVKRFASASVARRWGKVAGSFFAVAGLGAAAAL